MAEANYHLPGYQAWDQWQPRSALNSLLGFISCCNKPDFPDLSLWDCSLTSLQRFFSNNSGLCCCTMYTSTVKQCSLIVWQSSRPASFSPAGLTVWSNWLERWLATLSRLSTQVRIPVGLSVPGRYIGGSSAGLGKAQRIDSSLRADWLSCFFLAWWEWQVARQGCLVQLRKWGMWQSSRPANFLPARLTLWPNWWERWLAIPRFEYQWGCRCWDATIECIAGYHTFQNGCTKMNVLILEGWSSFRLVQEIFLGTTPLPGTILRLSNSPDHSDLFIHNVNIVGNDALPLLSSQLGHNWVWFQPNPLQSCCPTIPSRHSLHSSSLQKCLLLQPQIPRSVTWLEVFGVWLLMDMVLYTSGYLVSSHLRIWLLTGFSKVSTLAIVIVYMCMSQRILWQKSKLKEPHPEFSESMQTWLLNSMDFYWLFSQGTRGFVPCQWQTFL